MRADLPEDPVTFLFTDVEGSTRLLHQLGERAYADVLTEHRRVLREAFGRHGGVEVDTQGDALFFAFPTPQGALEAARDGAVALESGPIRVRVGIHTGHRGSNRRGIRGRRRAPGCQDRGRRERRTDPRVVADGAAGRRPVPAGRSGRSSIQGPAGAPSASTSWATGDFPPIRSLYRANLPVPATPFIGRDREVDAVAELLRREERLPRDPHRTRWNGEDSPRAPSRCRSRRVLPGRHLVGAARGPHRS